MIKKYYDQDCNLGMLDGKTVAIIGFGSQGHAHAMNLKESGVNVVVGLRPGSAHIAKAEAAGLKVMDIEDAAEREDRLFQTAPRDEVAAQNRTDDERHHTERTVVKTDFVLGQTQALHRCVGLQKEGYDLDYQTFGKAIEDDPRDVDPNIFLLEELRNYTPRFAHRLAKRTVFSSLCTTRRQHTPMVKT